MPGGNSVVDPPDPMPNSAVKRNSADGSVEFLHVKVGHYQAPNKEGLPVCEALFICVQKDLLSKVGVNKPLMKRSFMAQRT